jgi:hypothetical protein
VLQDEGLSVQGNRVVFVGSGGRRHELSWELNVAMTSNRVPRPYQ